MNYLIKLLCFMRTLFNTSNICKFDCFLGNVLDINIVWRQIDNLISFSLSIKFWIMLMGCGNVHGNGNVCILATYSKTVSNRNSKLLNLSLKISFIETSQLLPQQNFLIMPLVFHIKENSIYIIINMKNWNFH